MSTTHSTWGYQRRAEDHPDEIEASQDRGFGNWFKSHQKRLGLKDYQIAKVLNADKSRIHSLSRGSAHVGVTKKECKELSALFGVSLKEALNAATEYNG